MHAETKQCLNIFYLSDLQFVVAHGTKSEQLVVIIFYVVPFRWPTILPILDPQYVAKKIINAVLTDQVYLLLPRSMYLIAALKWLVHHFFYLIHTSHIIWSQFFHTTTANYILSVYCIHKCF